jgi:hypothetical protein
MEEESNAEKRAELKSQLGVLIAIVAAVVGKNKNMTVTGSQNNSFSTFGSTPSYILNSHYHLFSLTVIVLLIWLIIVILLYVGSKEVSMNKH